jgi:PEP-CTERM motif
MKRKYILGAALALGLSLVGTAQASTLFGATYTGAPTSNLYIIDQTTGAATLVGATGQNIGDMTNIGGSLVGIDLTGNSLWTLSATTGAASGAVAISGTRGVITSIAYDPVSKFLYGNTTGAFSGSDILYRIDTSTGVATTIGSLAVSNIFGLGFGQDGSLFGSAGGSLYSLNTLTAATGLIGSSSGGSLFDLATRPEDNVLFASPGTNSLLTLNKTTGASTTVGPFGSTLNIAGLAFVGGAVPEPTTWGMMIAGFGIVGATMRRKRRILALV